MIYEVKQFMMAKKKSKLSLHIWIDGASVVQVGDVEQAIV